MIFSKNISKKLLDLDSNTTVFKINKKEKKKMFKLMDRKKQRGNGFQ